LWYGDNAHHKLKMGEMAEIIFHGKMPVAPIDGDEAVKDLKLIDAIYLAARTGKRMEA
jgi:predicted dehydrogenase